MDLVKISFEDMLDHGDWSNQRKNNLASYLTSSSEDASK